MLHRIRKILNVTPYTITCEWRNGEVRTILMKDKLVEWAAEPGSVYKRLLDADIFMNVDLDTESQTLFWAGLIKMVDANGELSDATLDIDPEVLYQMSVPVADNKAA